MSAKNEENANFLPGTVATNFIKQKIGDFTKIRVLPFLHEPAPVTEKYLRPFLD